MLADLIAIGVIPTGGTPTPTPTPTPAPGPLTLAMVKQHLKVTSSAEDELLAQYVAAAAEHVERTAELLLSRREVTQEFARFEPRLPLFWGPAPSDVVVTYLDVDGAEAEIADGRVLRGVLLAPTSAGWPATECHSPVFVTYQAGYEDGAVPPALVSAQLLLIGHWYMHREAVATGAEASALPLGFDALLATFRRIRI